MAQDQARPQREVLPYLHKQHCPQSPLHREVCGCKVAAHVWARSFKALNKVVPAAHFRDAADPPPLEDNQRCCYKKRLI